MRIIDTLPPDLDPQIQVHTGRITLLGIAIGDDDFLVTFLQDKIQNITALLSKVSKLQSLHAKYQILKLSVNAKLRHLVRSLLSSRPPVQSFCRQFDQIIQSFFATIFHIQDQPPELIAQTSLSTTDWGLDLMSLADMSPPAFLASLHNMLSEYTIRNSHMENPAVFFNQRSYEQEAKLAWDQFHTLPD